MNLSKYIKHGNPPGPHIHEDAFIEEFRHVPKFGVAGKQRLQIAEEIEGGRQPTVAKSQKVLFDDFKETGQVKIDPGVNTWDIFGKFPTPYPYVNEAGLLHNPNHLSDKDIFKARWQEQNGYTNDFTQRQENATMGRPLSDIRNDEYQRAYNSFKDNMDWEYADVGGAAGPGEPGAVPFEMPDAMPEAAAAGGGGGAEHAAPRRKKRSAPEEIFVAPIVSPSPHTEEEPEVRPFRDWAQQPPPAAPKEQAAKPKG